MHLQAAFGLSIFLLVNLFTSIIGEAEQSAYDRDVDPYIIGETEQSAYDKEVDEGDCTRNYTTHAQVTTGNMMVKTTSLGWVVHMSSNHMAYHLAKQMLMTDDLPQKTLEGLCLRVDRNGIVSHFKGEKRTLMKCTYPYPYLENVRCNPKYVPVDHHLSGRFKATLAWSDDNGDNLIVVLCSRYARKKYWIMGSTSEELSSDVKSQVIDALSGLGFDSKQVLYQDRTNCNEAKQPQSWQSYMTFGYFDYDKEVEDNRKLYLAN
ncbi:unnamed protein product [Orchesella dallaii]|uniref:Apolipoprotein D n=1 Tax=Orchesella dallaii TaxID=48710 RepID=A0ABP1PTP3_9HEXA